MLDIFITIAPFFIIIAIGSILRLIIANDKWIEVLNKLGLYVGFPSIVISSFMDIDSNNEIEGRVIVYNFAILTALIVLALLITRLLRIEKTICNTYMVSSIFGNIAYLGFPFVTTIIPGSEGIVSIHIAIYLVVIFTLVVFILERSNGHSQKKTARLALNISTNPLLVSVFIGVGISYFKINVPSILKNTIEMIASAASTLVLIALGIFIIRKIHFNRDLLHAVCITTIKIIIVPIIFLIIYSQCSLGPQFKVSILQSAMPLAITPFALAEIYPLDKQIIAISILLSTAVSAITLTIFASLAGVG